MAYTGRLSELVPAGAEPVTLEEMKSHLRITANDEDALIAALIRAARLQVELFTGRALIIRSCRLALDAWPQNDGFVELPLPPLASITRLSLWAEDGTSSDVATTDYWLDKGGVPARLVFKNGIFPPAPMRGVAGITIDFKAGYGAAPQDVPENLRQAVRLLAACYYEQRGDESGAASPLVTSGAQALLQPYRMMGLI